MGATRLLESQVLDQSEPDTEPELMASALASLPARSPEQLVVDHICRESRCREVIGWKVFALLQNAVKSEFYHLPSSAFHELHPVLERIMPDYAFATAGTAHDTINRYFFPAGKRVLMHSKHGEALEFCNVLVQVMSG